MAITRRDFLKYSAVTGAGLIFGIFDLKPIVAYAQANPPVWTIEAISVCGYCSVGCSMIVGTPTTGTLAGYVTYVQGNPDSPINKGSLCSKGQASVELSTIVSDDLGTRIPNPRRLITVKHRAPYATNWDTAYMSMDTAISLIAQGVQATRDSTFIVTDPVTGVEPVNRCEGIASLGAAAFNNEAAYLITKLMRSLGVVYLEHQARV
ncbi:MAG: twin-arginine translocation signal domain-containing protein [Nitrospirota bacterium]